MGVLTGVPWADPDPDLVRAALVPHVPIEDGHLGYRIVDSGRLRPQLSDLNVTRVDEVEPALHAWRHAALRYWSVDGWLEVESIQPLLVRLDAVGGATLALVPQLTGARKRGKKHWVPHLAVGALEVGMAAFTKTRASQPKTGRAAYLAKLVTTAKVAKDAATGVAKAVA